MKLFVLIFLSSISVWAKQSLLLSAEEYKTLPSDQQVKYIRSVQKVLADMTKKAIYMADEKESNDRMPASASSALPDDFMEYMGNSNPSGGRIKAVEDKTTPTTQAQNSAKSDVPPTPENVSTTQGVPTASAPQTSNLAASPKDSNPSKPVASASKYEKENDQIETVIPVEKKPANPGATYNVQNQKPQEKVDLSGASRTAGLPAEAASLRKIDAKNENKSKEVLDKKTSPKPEPSVESKTIYYAADAKLASDNPRGSYRCMYSGWVITEDPCAPVVSFPLNFAISKIDSSKMICDEGKTMCNPTVFGLKIAKDCESILNCPDTAQPICVRKGGYPTEDCFKQTSFKEAVVASEINAHLAPDKYNEFVHLMDDLCDKEQIQKNQFAEIRDGQPRTDKSAAAVRADIERTCKSATAKLALVTEPYRLQSREARQEWLGKKEQSKKKKLPSKENSTSPAEETTTQN